MVDIVVKGDSSWKLLFEKPDEIRGLRAEKTVLPVVILKMLAKRYALHPTKRFSIKPVYPPLVPKYEDPMSDMLFFNVQENVDGQTAAELLETLDRNVYLGIQVPDDENAAI